MGRTHGKGRGRRRSGGPPKPQLGSTSKATSKKPTPSARPPASSSSSSQKVLDCSIPSVRPVPPNFQILPSHSTSDEEKERFWEAYKRVVNEYNIETIRFERNLLTFKGLIEDWANSYHDRPKPIDLTTCMDDTAWTKRGSEAMRTYYETNIFVIKRCAHPPEDWYKPTYLDLSGPLGTLYYRESSAGEADDFFQVDFHNESAPFKFNAIHFSLTIFNYLERTNDLHGVLSTGFRVTFPKAGSEVLDTTFKIQISTPEPGSPPATNRTRILVKLLYKWDVLPRHVEFVVDGRIPEERIHSYPLQVTEDAGCDYVIDIPLRTQVLGSSITKRKVGDKVIKKTVVTYMRVPNDIVVSEKEEVVPESDLDSKILIQDQNKDQHDLSANDLPNVSDCSDLPDIEPTSD